MSPNQIRALGGTLASREAVSDRALRRQLGEGQLAQDTRRTDLARDELRGYSELYPGGMREDTAAVREGKAARALASSEASAGREFESGERALDRREASNQASQARLLAREELYGTSDPYSQTGETLQGRLARQEQDRYNAATTLEAERYATQRGDYAADISRRNQQDALQRQFEGLAASRAIDALKQSDPGYEVDDREAALITYLLRGGPVQTVPPVGEGQGFFDTSGQNTGGGRGRNKLEQVI